MPKARTKSKHNSQNKPSSSYDVVLDTFIETGHFSLANEIISFELLTYFGEYLKKQPKIYSSKLDYKFYLENVTFNLGSTALYSQEIMWEPIVDAFLDQVFSFSPRWSVIAFDNVSVDLATVLLIVTHK